MTTPTSPTAVSPPIKHTTTNATPTNRYLDTGVAPLNSNPIELDSTPVSPVIRKESWKSKAADMPSGRFSGGGGRVIGPDEDEEAYEEFSGEKGGNEVVREKRKKLLAERLRDPAVLVDIPPTPKAEEYEMAEEAMNEGTPEAVAAARLKRVLDKGVDGDGPPPEEES